MVIPRLPAFVEDTYGKKYTLASNEAHCGGQGAMFQKENLAIKILFINGDPSHTIQTDEKEYLKYQRKLVHIMAFPKLNHLTIPIASLKSPYCGYVMQFMSGLQPLDNYLHVLSEKDGGYLETLRHNGGLKKRIKLLRNLSDVLRNVHNHGLVYCDLTPNNVFVSQDDSEAEAWLIDVDNLCYGNDVHSHWQTPWYRAPEVYKGEANSTFSDCYSFALIAFGLLTFSKPFDGLVSQELEDDSGWDDDDSGWDQPIQDQESIAQQKAESGELSYVGELNEGNHQCYGIPYQYVMTAEMQDLFMKTFGPVGRKNPQARPTMNEWFTVLDSAYNQLVLCPSGHRHFGETCIMCSEQTTSKNLKIVVRQIFYMAEAPISRDEDQEVDNIKKSERVVYETYFTAPATSEHRKIRTIEIPWKCFAVARDYHDKESAALTITVKDGQITHSECFDRKLKLKLCTAKQQYVCADYNEQYHYEIGIEEVK